MEESRGIGFHSTRTAHLSREGTCGKVCNCLGKWSDKKTPRRRLGLSVLTWTGDAQLLADGRAGEVVDIVVHRDDRGFSRQGVAEPSVASFLPPGGNASIVAKVLQELVFLHTGTVTWRWNTFWLT